MRTRTLAAIVCGLIFGAGLAISDMINPGRVLAFLDVAGSSDPSLAFGALIPSALALLPTNRRGNAVLFGLNSSRALVGWRQTDLAQAAGLSEMSVKNIERRVTDSRMSTMQAIRSALEATGVILIDENGEGPGVRLRKKG
ncbi:helix-turn-helix domain-containing protein [Sinorhizobium fredii]|uniref:helix-turn-helix domain-containing protein n=1 Tax=Rhizobium fredii TaxID=380 RepID=UPI001F3E5635|nr:helix-turn-helix transcriptional regulator [Sinorhizobium fredii]